MSVREDICVATAEAVGKAGGDWSPETVAEMLETPGKPGFGDWGLPCFTLAKQLKNAPPKIAAALAGAIDPPDSVERVEAIGPYLNFWPKGEALAAEVLPAIHAAGRGFGGDTSGQGRTIAMDYSHPNIAKPFGVAHLRSTVIGHSLKRICQKLGHDVVGINHLGDWGTQFGKLIVAFREWGDEADLEHEPIRALFDLYVRFHQEADANKDLENRARAEFKKLEDGDAENTRLWKWFSDLSLREFQRIYGRLGVEFESYAGEAFYNDKLEPLTVRLMESGVARESEGALVVDALSDDEPPLLLRKADGATLYATRDLAAAEHRWETYRFHKLLYIVGSAQALHFKQLFATLAKMGHEWSTRMVHVDFGWIKFGEEMMSTRRGNIVFLDEVLTESAQRARTIIREKNPDLAGADADRVAEAVGVGAVVFWQLSTRRQKDVAFTWDEVLNFDGRTGPYLQYTHARLCSLLAKANRETTAAADFALCSRTAEERRLLMLLADYPSRVRRAARDYEPAVLAVFLLELAAALNKFYQAVRVISDDEDTMDARLLLVRAVRDVMADGLYLLGIETPPRM